MFIDNQVTRYENGVTNRPVSDIFNSLRTMDPTRYHTLFEDFDFYVAANWTVTETDAGATQALTDADGGVLLITNSAGDDDLVGVQKIGESFLFEVGKKLFFKARLALNDATESDLAVGLLITDASPFDVTDGVFFLKADGAATVSFISEKNNAQVSSGAIASLEDAEMVDLAFFYDGVDRLYYSVNGATQGYINPGASFPDDEVLTVSFALANGEAVAKTLSVDYIFAAKER